MGQKMAPPDSVLITSAEGAVQDVVPAAAAGEGIEYHPGVLTPGFVNCHCHLELSHMKGRIRERTGLVDFLSAVIRGRGDGDAVQPAIAAAEQEMLDGGIVAVGDICNTMDTLEQKKKGRLTYYNFIETIGFVEQRGCDADSSRVWAFVSCFEKPPPSYRMRRIRYPRLYSG